MNKLRILYLAPENYSGTLSTFRKAHLAKGHYCRYITFFKSKYGFEEDICLNLPLMPDNKVFCSIKQIYLTLFTNNRKNGDYRKFPFYWNPENFIEKLFFKFRDRISEKYILDAIDKYHLFDFDIYHFDGGVDLFRDSRFVKKLKQQNKKVICCYHGTDMRERGIIKEVDEVSDLNLTSEVDLMYRYPKLNYLFLPFDTKKYQPKEELNKPIRICHATRNREYKGSNTIIRICRELEKEYGIVFHLIEKLPHEQTLKIKSQSDIYIDQVSNIGGWGYGMNSVEALSMGLCCCTNLVPEYEKFIPDHPFVNVDSENLKRQLIKLIENPSIIKHKGIEGKIWVEKHHDIDNVVIKLYEYYKEYKII